ncbi:MAG: 4-hydroxy-tetrahydrodipicolinate reductase [Candidatus Methanospirareceae archaeon]
MIRVAVAGARGRMGSHVVRDVIEEESMELVAAFDIVDVGKEIEGSGVKISDAADMEDVLNSKKPDVFVDFTNAAAAVENVKIAARNKIKLVVGTTGFTEEQFREMKEVIEGNVPAVISPNFSIGVNVFWKLISFATPLLPGYEIEIVEMHHSKKKDAPSGTAKKAAEIIESSMKKKAKIVYGRHGALSQREIGEIGIHAVRAGDIVGDHIVLYAGKGERIEIIHRAHSREAFARGVIKAIEWVNGVEKSGIYSMDDVMGWGMMIEK